MADPIEFIDDQRTQQVTRYSITQAVDRFVDITEYENGKCFIVRVQKAGNPISELVLSEKAFFMLTDSMLKFLDQPADTRRRLTVREDMFDGNFLKPHSQLRQK